MGGLDESTRVTFVNTYGSASTSLSRTLQHLHGRWSAGEENGLATPQHLVEQTRRLLDTDMSDRAIGREVGLSHTTVSRIRRGDEVTHRSSRWRVRKMRLRVMNPSTFEFNVGHIRDVVDDSTDDAIEIVTLGGRSIVGAPDAWMWTPDGPARFAEIAERDGGSLLANGIPPHQDHTWLKARRDEGLAVAAIAEQAGVSYHTIRKWLRIHQLQFTAAERNFAPGNVPWNAGAAGYSNRPHRYSADGLERVRAARSGANSNFWRGGVTAERASVAAWTTAQAPRIHARFDYTCQACSKRGVKLHAHHVRPVWASPEDARNVDNLVSVCERCHREIHQSIADELGFAAAVSSTRLPPLPTASIVNSRRLIAHPDPVSNVRVISGVSTVVLKVQAPDSTFVANGLIARTAP